MKTQRRRVRRSQSIDSLTFELWGLADIPGADSAAVRVLMEERISSLRLAAEAMTRRLCPARRIDGAARSSRRLPAPPLA